MLPHVEGTCPRQLLAGNVAASERTRLGTASPSRAGQPENTKKNERTAPMLLVLAVGRGCVYNGLGCACACVRAGTFARVLA